MKRKRGFWFFIKKITVNLTPFQYEKKKSEFLIYSWCLDDIRYNCNSGKQIKNFYGSRLNLLLTVKLFVKSIYKVHIIIIVANGWIFLKKLNNYIEQLHWTTTLILQKKWTGECKSFRNCHCILLNMLSMSEVSL
jgi:hypothetical protein